MSGNAILYLATFVANAAILVFEIAGARLLAPYLGTSVEVWAGTIAVILGSMAAGYAIGGTVADKYPEKRALSLVFFCSSIAAFVAWGMRDLIPGLIVGAHTASITVAAIATATLLFAPTVIFLAIVSPFIAKFLLTRLDASARVVGNLNAIGTVGSIVGALSAGALLIPLFPLGDIFLGIALSLLALSLLVSFSHFGKKGVAALVVFLLGAVISGAVHVGPINSTIIADLGTAYNRIWVLEMPYEGEIVRAMRTDPFGTQCGMKVLPDGSVDEKTLAFPYLRAFNDFAHTAFATHDPGHALFLGGCNYSYPRVFLQDFTNTQGTVVEIDPGMTKAAKMYFGLSLSDWPTLSVAHEDARRFLTHGTDTYDMVFMDVFGSFSNTPHHLTTEESFAAVAKRMAEDGLFLMNIIAVREGSASTFASSLLASLASAFPNAAIYYDPVYYKTLPQNLILAASKDRELPDMVKNATGDVVLQKLDPSLLAASVRLTDDFAPVEALTHSLRERVF